MIPIFSDPVHAVASHKAQDPVRIALSVSDLGLVSCIQVHDMEHPGIIDPRILLPGQPGPIGADRKPFLIQTRSHHHILVAVQIDPINASAHVHVKNTVLSLMGQAGQIQPELAVRLGGRKEKLLRQSIGLCLITIKRNACVSLSAAPVHIAVDQKIHSPPVGHLQDLHPVAVPSGPEVVCVPSSESKNTDTVSFLPVIGPQLPVGHKGRIPAAFAFLCVQPVSIGDPQQNALS